MKKNLILFASIIVTGSFISQAQAQYRVTENDGIAASPKVRQMMNERQANFTSVSVANPAVVVQTSSAPAIAASPKVSQFLAEQRANQAALKAPTVYMQPESAQTGIAASPRVQKEISERTTPAIQIAPLK